MLTTKRLVSSCLIDFSYEESKIAKCCVAYKRIKREVPFYTEGSLVLNHVSNIIVLQDIATLILFAQDLIV